MVFFRTFTTMSSSLVETNMAHVSSNRNWKPPTVMKGSRFSVKFTPTLCSWWPTSLVTMSSRSFLNMAISHKRRSLPIKWRAMFFPFPLRCTGVEWSRRWGHLITVTSHHHLLTSLGTGTYPYRSTSCNGQRARTTCAKMCQRPEWQPCHPKSYRESSIAIRRIYHRCI